MPKETASTSPHPLRPMSSDPTFLAALEARIDAGELEVPALNATVLRLLSLCSEGDYEVEEVTRLVRSDQTLAGQVLSIANSVAYSPMVAVTSIQDAVNRLGARVITDICVTMVVKEKVFKVKGERGEMVRHLWQRASIAGVYGQKIGQLMRGDHELSMLVGLLHDIGTPILVRLYEELEELLGVDLPLDELEELLGPLHARVGRIVIQRWGLPLELEGAAQFHHDYAEAGDFRTEAAIAHLADLLTDWTLEDDARGNQRLRELEVVEELGLDLRELGGLFTARERIREIAGAFG